MRLISKFKKQTEANLKGAANDIMQLATMQDEIIKQYNVIADDYIRLKRHISNNGLWGMVKKLRAEFDELRGHTAVIVTEHDRKFRELASNGVVRDLRKAEKRIAALESELERISEYVSEEFTRLENNGVATSINKLNAEVFNDKKEVETPFKGARSFAHMLLGDYDVTEVSEEATLAGKVDAIIEHLGLDVTVKPQEIKEAKVTAKKVSTKKKGRR